MLRRLIRRLKCKLGLHHWVHPIHWKRGYPDYGYMGQECFYCKTRMQVRMEGGE